MQLFCLSFPKGIRVLLESPTLPLTGEPSSFNQSPSQRPQHHHGLVVEVLDAILKVGDSLQNSVNNR